jgi:ubiquitin-conjugating enzyme E2 variant
MSSSSSPLPLVAGYSSRFRIVEIGAIGAFVLLFLALAARAYAAHVSLTAADFGVLLLGGALLADFGSGLVHWSADTWGNQHWPIVGPTLIRSFREHHLDPEAITRHGFVEANGATALVLLPLMLGVHALLPAHAAAWTRLDFQGAIFGLSLFAFTLMTNQIHKWAHLSEPPPLVRQLQRARLILSVDHHRGHHAAPHTGRYCITTGWLNPVLDRFDFFRISERAIQTVSGLQPREDDLRLIALAGDALNSERDRMFRHSTGTDRTETSTSLTSL